MSYTAHVLRRYLPILAFISILTMYVEMAVLPSIYRIEEEFSVSAILRCRGFYQPKPWVA